MCGNRLHALSLDETDAMHCDDTWAKCEKWRWKLQNCHHPNRNLVQMLFLFLTLFLYLIGCVTCQSTLSRRVVTTKQGIIQGVIGPGNVRSSTSSYPGSFYGSGPWGYGGRPIVEIFKGIPYASAPVDSLRFETPGPLSNTAKNDVYVANISKPPCPTSYTETLSRTSTTGDPLRALKRSMHLEDCLFLDIYMPYADRDKSEGYPVLVYANSQPEEGSDGWDGSSVAALGNIMVIMFRYRVGVLGFVQPGFSEDVRSNFGLWDQLAALQWIKEQSSVNGAVNDYESLLVIENVKMFGGDPSKITLMGYDLDASLAGILALSPISAHAYGGLFQRLVLLNGSPFSPTSINHQPSDTTLHLARALKCPLHERSGELLSCLRYPSTSQLFQVAENLGTPLLTYRFAPKVDGTIVKEDFLDYEGRANSELLGRYDLLMGIREGPTLPKLGQPPWQSLNLDKFVTAVIKLTLRMEPTSEPTAEVKRNLMRAIFKEYGSSPSMKDLVSDFILVHPTIQLLNAHSRVRNNTFFYVFNDFDPLQKNRHSEIPYIFSTDVYNWKWAGSTETIAELQPFEALITLLANFVRTGDPNVIDRSEHVQNSASPWPKYTEDSGKYLELGHPIGVPSNYRRSQVIFWSKIFPAIIKPFAASPEHNYTGFDTGDPHFGENPFGHPRGTAFPPVQEPDVDYGTANSSISQNTVVLIGCLLLLLNTLCFLGLFYQRERLKRAEVQMRRRYMESQPATENGHQEHPEEDGSAYVPNPKPRGIVPPRDAMSETETENGFGPDFLGPNYDPRTKVNRWMNLQNRLENSPVPEMTPFNDIPYLSNNHHHRHHSVQPPMQIHLASVQRKPIEVLPHLPYQEPFQPSLSFDIPYADSRATSPSIAMSTAYNNNLTTNNFNNMNRRSMPVFDSRETPTPSTTKRGSVLIIRDLDPIDDEMEKMSVKYVPVKTGTLKRSVAVGGDDAQSSTTNNDKEMDGVNDMEQDSVRDDDESTTEPSAPQAPVQTTIIKKITFADDL